MADQPDITFAPKPTGGRFRDLEGRRFGRLEVLGYAGHQNTRTAWHCRCDCDAMTLVTGLNLSSGNTKSCGCLNREKTGMLRRTHGQSKTTEYEIYTSAKKRCEVETCARYDDYGGRGIRFEFASFEEFVAHMGPRPSLKHSLDRIDNDGHYEPGNVHWATDADQARNKRNNVLITIGGVTKIQHDWARQYGIKHQVIWDRRNRNWCDECSVSVPVGGGTCIHRHDNVMPQRDDKYSSSSSMSVGTPAH